MDMKNHLQRTYWPSVRAGQAEQWVRALSRIVAELDEHGEEWQRPADLWLRLWGLLDDIGPGYRTMKKELSIPDGAATALVAKLEELDAAVRAKIAQLRAKLSREDVVVAQYLRHCVAHVFQDKYELKESQKAVKLLDLELRREEVDEIISGFTDRYGTNETRFAIEIAKLIREDVEQLVPVLGEVRAVAMTLILLPSVAAALPNAARW